MIKSITLIHNETIDFIKENSQKIESLFASSAFSEEKLLALITQRETLLQTYLDTVEPLNKSFLQSESDNNQLLEQTVIALRKNSENELHQLVRGRKVVKKYNKS